MSARISGRTLGWVVLLALAVIVGIVGVYLATRPLDAPPLDDSEAVLARERAAAYFDEDLFTDARQALEPLVERGEPADLLRAVNVELAALEFARAEALLERAENAAPNDPTVPWSRYRIARDEGRLEDALRHVRRAVELAPDDYPTRLALANTLNELALDDPALFAEADQLYRELLARGQEYSGSWYLTTLYRYSNLLRFAEGRGDDADRYLAEYQRLQQTLSVPSRTDLDRGSFGSIAPPPIGALAAGPTAAGSPLATPLGEPLAAPLALEGVVGLSPFVLRDDAESEDANTLVQRLASAPQRVLIFGRAGIQIVGLENGELTVEAVSETPTTFAVAVDLDAEERAFGVPIGPTEILSADRSRLVEFHLDEGAWRERDLWSAPGEIRAAVPVDFDHEGDLDLLVVGDFGARLLRNDGAGAADGGFTDVSAAAGLPAGAFTWATVHDLDSDQDVDLFFGDAERAYWFDNERGGEFADRSADWPGDPTGLGPLVLGDFDGDGVVDVHSSHTSRLWFGDGFGRFEPEPLEVLPMHRIEPTPLDETRRFLTVMTSAEVSSSRLVGVDRELAEPMSTVLDAPLARLMTFADLDGDRRDELVLYGPGGLHVLERKGGGNTLRLWLAGEKDNRRGVGAIVEVRSGPAYRRYFWDGLPRTLDVEERTKVDVVRVTWPNGVIQTLVDLPIGTDLRIKQKEGLVGSCPFLYSWNGETFEFISDVLGITPLGLPMGPGMLVPPDHDEYVLVRGDQLVPKDGKYVLQFTEELREVTYLDRARLDVVDHPGDVDVYPNERFTFPPFPEAHTHTVRTALAPTRATGSDGRDWTRELSRADESFAAPFERLGGAFLGLATPHYLELEFDPEAVGAAESLRLVMTGWFYWTDASVNMASAHHPGAEFVPPLLQVPDTDGGWRTIEPPLGFPAGKLKTMVVDVGAHLDRADPRMRIFSTLRLYWDAIHLAVGGDDAEFRVTSLEPSSAELWARGFSAPSPQFAELGLEWFRWDELEAEPRWNQHPGLYTRFGECEPLLHAADDRYVIMGAGDALTLTFDADGLPPVPPGWSRDFLVYLDGWAKDRDPNSKQALFVEPLPFHGMSAYPYDEDESFPDTPLHREWRARWNTRPAQRLIPSIVPTGSRP
ncbi:MAG: FG-GAP-like repeat-containing protein [Planctomycetota bacterium]